MTLTTVYVHGNGNKVAAPALKRVWDEALFAQEMGDATRMAYWAPLRYRCPLAGPEPDELQELPTTAPFEALVAATEPPEAFVAQTLAEADAEAGIAASPFEAYERRSTGAADRLEPWLRRMTLDADALAAGSAGPFELLPLPRGMRTAAFRAMVKLTFKDVHAYFFGGLAEPMREVVRACLRDIDGPVVAIGHSLGSIIAYDVLREPEFDGLSLPLLVTVGSPLGVTEIQDLLATPLEVPRAAVAWRNVCDRLDFVALDKTLRPQFAPAERCSDFTVRNRSANRHGAREYLGTAPVREPILALAALQTASAR